MENFEYSIQLNDRDWAEFYSVSEECSIIQAALATADEQCSSDMEQGDSEDAPPSTDRLVPARAGSTPAPGTGHCPGEISLPRPMPGRPALEEVLSGSEDEMDLGSVSRFLCENDKPGSPPQTPLMPSTQDRQLPCSSGAGSAGLASHAVEKPLQPQDSPRKELGQAAQRAGAALLAGEEGRGVATEAHGYLPEGALQVRELPGERLPGSPEKTVPERPVLAVDVSSPALAVSGGMARPVGDKANWSLCLEPGLPDPKSDTSQNPSGEPLQPKMQGDHLGPGQALTGAGSGGDSLRVGPPSGPVHLGRSREHQGTPPGEEMPWHGAVTLESSAPAMGVLTPAAILRESRGERIGAAPVLGGPEDDQAVGTARSKEVKLPAAQPFPGELKKTRQAKPTQATDLGIQENVSLVRSSKPTAAQGEAGKSSTGEPQCLGSTEAFGGDAYDRAQGRQRSGLLNPYSAAEDSQEGDIPALTWPEMYDYFFCDAQEQRGTMNSQGGMEKTPLFPSEKEQELPEMYGPEMYEYFFHEPQGSGGRGGGRGSKDKGLEPDRFSSLEQTPSLCKTQEEPGSATAGEPSAISIPEVYEHFFTNGAGGRRSWGGIFLSMPVLEARKTLMALKSLLRKPMLLLRRSPPDHRALVPRVSKERLPILQLRPTGRSQLKPEDLGMVLALAERPHPPLALTQKDMCLVFVAFASWAVKTSDLHAPDAWKTVLLANFGTLSAIRYFRRQVVEGRHGN
ncbi:PGC-1 and ERR-induced regulator in muscle protein 1 [Emydura macquarii macquarii]|uniref:PGC-1 and ERR-induced regulator in muscle protein 1 n=1 Tax=Emydura macquarii macquarii TaxID=1129001 RepID=UPI00352A7440